MHIMRLGDRRPLRFRADVRRCLLSPSLAGETDL